ncbi:MAG TPA: hypothetical protein VGM73_14040 [Candidatus Didemnitutus sp.]|jgi:hypothetical protein
MNPDRSVGYETTDASVRGVLIGAAAVALGVAASLAVAFLFIRPFDRRTEPERSFVHGQGEERPLESDWRAVRAETRAHLEGYGWVDRRAGLARIPIDRAMAIMAAQGRPIGGDRP